MRRDYVFILALCIQLFLTAFLLSSCNDNTTGPSPTPSPTPTPISSVSLSWDASVSPNVAGYRIYYGSVTRDYTVVTDVGNVLTATITNIPSTEIFIAATAYDAAGDESDFSNEVTWPTGQTLGSSELNLRSR